MKALVYCGPQDVRYREFQDPVLDFSDHVLVKVKKSGICGSDLHIYHGEYIKHETGFVIGHEFIGEVLEVGENVRRFSPGDHVLSAASIGCADCSECRKGRVDRCRTRKMRGYGQGPFGNYLQGVQAEFVSVPAADTTLLRIPEGVTDDNAILLTDNLPTAYFGTKHAEICPGQSVLVIGLGPVGLLAVECAFIMGAARVYVMDRIPERMKYAQSLGAISITGDNIKEQIKAATGGDGIDAIIDAVGNESTINLSLQIARVGGIISVVGFFLEKQFAFPMSLVQRKNITFRIGLCPVQAFWEELIPLVQAGRIKGQNVITHHLGLSEGTEAYKIFAARKNGVMKIILESDK
jgi:2-desacetyl-2-hydroxyethyl bacteriochlorophyllide A dehydrogenase